MKEKFFFPNLKPFLSENGIRFADFVRAVQSNEYSMGIALSERTFHNATRKDVGVSKTSKNSVLRLSEIFFRALNLEGIEEALEFSVVENSQRDLFS